MNVLDLFHASKRVDRIFAYIYGWMLFTWLDAKSHAPTQVVKCLVTDKQSPLRGQHCSMKLMKKKYPRYRCGQSSASVCYFFNALAAVCPLFVV